MSFAQKGSKIGYVDMDYILSNLEEYKVANEQFALQVEQWHSQIDKQAKRIEVEKQKLEAEKPLLTPELIKDRQQEIDLLQYKLDEYKEQKFNAQNGEYITQKFMLAKPIQDQVFNIVQEIGTLRKYDMIFEKSEVSLLYSAHQHNLSGVVLRILKRKDNADDRNKEIGELLKESYDFEFLDEKAKKKAEQERIRQQRQIEAQKRVEENLRKKAEMQAMAEKRKAEQAAKKEKEKAEREQKRMNNNKNKN